MAKSKPGWTDRPVEEPQVTIEDKYGSQRSKFTHPAYGQIGISRVSGRANLYGSDFAHNSYIALRIHRSELHRDLSRDWYFARNQEIEVALSESQWATLVSAMNVGEGVPCTIQYVKGEMMPSIPHRNEDDAFKNDIRHRLKEALEQLKGLQERIEANSTGLSKARAAELVGPVKNVISQLTSGLPFVADSFDEHVEEKIEKAKIELHGYMTATVQRAGLKALQAGEEPIELITVEKDDNA